MSLKDIEKLREKVDKDPNSKLFVPLAEEYRKEGMLDEAIQVLLKGIERQPAYMSARVSLGKIYVEKSMMPEARAEFENVITAIPDNLYAHKKLAEIYRDSGEREMAIKSFRTVIRLNAMDEEAQANLADLEALGGEEQEPAPEPEPAAEEPEFAEPEVAEAPPSAPEEEVPAGAPSLNEDELAAFKDSLFGNEGAGGEEEAIALAEEEEIGMMEEADEGGISFGDINDVLQETKAEAEPAPAVPDIVIAEPTPVEEEIVVAEEPVPPIAAAAAPPSPAAPEVQRPAPSADVMEEADRLVGAGDFGGAISIYRQALEANPGDRKILQRVEELKILLKLLGKDKEVLIGKLNEFLEGIARRRDEFFRNP